MQNGAENTQKDQDWFNACDRFFGRLFGGWWFSSYRRAIVVGVFGLLGTGIAEVAHWGVRSAHGRERNGDLRYKPSSLVTGSNSRSLASFSGPCLGLNCDRGNMCPDQSLSNLQNR